VKKIVITLSFLFVLFFCFNYIVTSETLGNTNEGMDYESPNNGMVGSYYTVGSNGGCVNNITFKWFHSPDGGAYKHTKCAIYNSYLELIASGESKQCNLSDPGNGEGWTTVDFCNSPYLSAGETYFLWAWTNSTGGVGFYYEDSGGNGVYTKDLTYVYGNCSGWPDLLRDVSTLDADGNLSIYVNYSILNPPYDVDAEVDSYSDINISWTKGTGANRTIIRRKVGSYPTDETDGTLVYNGTGSYNLSSMVFNSYYSLFSYNDTKNVYSPAAYLIFSALKLNCYNESDSSSGIDFSVNITNSSLSEHYSANGISTPSYIDMRDIPTGENCSLSFDAVGYYERIFTMDLTSGVWTNVSVYLSSDANLYYIKVINDFGEPVDSASITVCRVIDGKTRDISTGYTDYYGVFPIYLSPGVKYYVNISASGYTSIVLNTLFTDPTYYGYNYPIIYQLRSSISNYTNESSVSDCIVFTGESTGNTAFVNLTNYQIDGCGLIYNFSIWVWEINTSSNITSYFYSYNDSVNQEVDLSFSIDVNNTYHVCAFINHSVFDSFWTCLYINPTASNNNYSRTSASEFDSLFDAIFGSSSTITWHGFLGIFVLLVCLFAFGQRSAGISVIICGFVMLGFNAVFNLILLSATVSIFMIVIGILIQWNVERRYR